MRLEDAALYLELDCAPETPDAAAVLATAAIAGGVDVLEMPGGDAMSPAVRAAIVEVCRREDALAVVTDDCAAVLAAGADGVLLTGPDVALGYARATLGMAALVGVRAKAVNDAQLALEVGVDYLVYAGGAATPGVLAMLPRAAGSIVYAGRVDGPETAREVVAGGMYRLSLTASQALGDDVTESIAVFARLIGRCL